MLAIAIVAGAALALGGSWNVIRSLRPLLLMNNDVRIESSNRQLAGLRFWILFVLLITKSILRRLGVLGSPKYAETKDPNIYMTIGGRKVRLSMPFSVTREDIAAYAAAAGSVSTVDWSSDTLHLQLFLSAMTEPAMLALLSTRACPLDPVGSVNVRNRFELVDPAAAILLVSDTTSETRGYVIQASLEPGVRKVKRGWESDLVVELRTLDERTIFRQTFTMLQFARHRSSPDQKPTESEVRSDMVLGAIEMSQLDPPRWAILCKDYNPIHFSTLAARMLGFRSTIAHGNHVAAKALGQAHEKNNASWMEVEFKRPVFLPARLDIVRGSDTGIDREADYIYIKQADKAVVILKYGS